MAGMRDEATFRVKAGLAEMLKGGVIMDVVNAEQAKIAEDAGAAAVMALERVPADIRRDGGVARMSDPMLIKGIQEAVTIPVMAKARIGHFAEAQVLEALEVDYVDESEVLTPADEANHIDKWAFKVPFVCGATNLGEALRRIGEGAAMIRSKGEAGTGDIVEAVRHMRAIRGEIRRLHDARRRRARHRRQGAARRRSTSCAGVAEDGKLPVVLFCAGGIATPADAALMMQLGAEGVFVGSGIFKSEDPAHARRGDRRGDHALPGPRARRPRLRGPRHGDALAGDAQARGAAAARQPRLVAPRRWSASSPCRATSRRTRRMLRDARRRACARCACPPTSTGSTALVMPGGESTTMTLGIEREGLAEPLRELVARRHAGARHLRRDDHARPRAPRPAWTTLRARNAFGRQIRSFEADLDIPGIDGPPVRAVFIRAPWIAERGDGVEILAAVDGHPVAARQDNMLVISFHPEIAGETRVHELFLAQVVARAEPGRLLHPPRRVGRRTCRPRLARDPSRRRPPVRARLGAGARARRSGCAARASRRSWRARCGRAQETAQAIGEVLGLPVETDDDLYEVRQSDAYHAAAPTLRRAPATLTWMPDAAAGRTPSPGAESFADDRRARVTRAGAASRRIDAERVLVRHPLGLPALLPRR